jgi:hypothetical protein
MRGNWDWNIIPEDKAEWIIFCVALLIVGGAGRVAQNYGTEK